MCSKRAIVNFGQFTKNNCSLCLLINSVNLSVGHIITLVGVDELSIFLSIMSD